MGDDEEPSSADRDAVVLAPFMALVDKSLVQTEEQADGELRFRMLESIRDYARERLVSDEELEEAQQRHTRYFLTLAEEAAPVLQGASQRAVLERLQQEHENLQAVLARSVAEGQIDIEARMCVALHYFWYIRGYLVAGDRCLAEALSRSEGAALPAGVQAKLLQGASLLA